MVVRCRVWLLGLRQHASAWQQLAALFCVYLVLRQVVQRACVLPLVSYERPVLVATAVTHLPMLAILGVLALRVLAPAGSPREQLRWQARDLPWFAFLSVAPLTWYYCTYDINLFLGQTHAVDRLVLLGLWLGTLMSPLAFAGYICQLFILIGQFDYPEVFYYTMTDKALPVGLACMLCAAWLASPVVRVRRTVLHAGLLLVWMAHYVGPWVAKLNLGPHPLHWLLNDNLANLFATALENGWLSSLDPAQATRVHAFLVEYGAVVRGATFAVELAPIGALLYPWIAPWIACAAVLLHLGIFASSGIFFWKWVVADAVLAIFCWTRWRRLHRRSCGPQLLLPTLAFLPPFLVVGGAPHLGWLDTPYNAMFDLEVEQADGQRVSWSRQAMAPFDMVFAQNRFYFLTQTPLPPIGTYGATTDERLAKAMMSVDPGEFRLAARVLATNQYNAESAATFSDFLRRYFENHRRVSDRHVVPSWLRAPNHIWTSRGVLETENPSRIHVRFRESLSHPSGMTVLTDSVVLSVNLRVSSPQSLR